MAIGAADRECVRLQMETLREVDSTAFDLARDVERKALAHFEESELKAADRSGNSAD
jgi:hypothetical protein